MVRQAVALHRFRRSFRSLYHCLVLAISAALLWQSWHAYTRSYDLESVNQVQHSQDHALHTSNIDLLKADYLPWVGSSEAQLHHGHRSHHHIDVQPVQRCLAPTSSFATTQDETFVNNGASVEQVEAKRAEPQIAVHRVPGLALVTPSSTFAAAGDVLAGELTETVLYKEAVQVGGINSWIGKRATAS